VFIGVVSRAFDCFCGGLLICVLAVATSLDDLPAVKPRARERLGESKVLDVRRPGDQLIDLARMSATSHICSSAGSVKS
jgi:hypothetical protein